MTCSLCCTSACCAHIKPTDLLIAAALIDTHGAPHLKPIADRLAAAARPEKETEDGDPA